MAAPACHSAVSNACTMSRLFMHAGKQDAMQLFFNAMAHSVIQMSSTNCGNDNQV